MSRTSHSPMTSRQRGFTIVELMVVVAIVAVLAALAAPTFTPMIERWRVRASLDNLQNSIYLARSEAIKRGGNIVMVRKESEDSCTSTGPSDWKCGWVVFHDRNRDGNQAACPAGSDDPECPIQEVSVSSNVTVTLSATNAGRLFLNRSGALLANNTDLIPINLLQADAMAKGRDLSNASSRKLCVRGAGQIKSILGSEDC